MPAYTPLGIPYEEDYADPADFPAADQAQAVAVDALITERAYAARSVNGGQGLTGGGTLTTDRTLHVGAGNGIDVTADAVAVDYAAFDGRYARVYVQATQPAAGNIGDIWCPT